MAFGGRLKLSDFGLNYEGDTSRFAESQWPIPKAAYLVYRVFLVLYLVGWNLVDWIDNGSNIGVDLVFLTEWTYIMLTFYAVSSCVGAFYFTFARRDALSDDRSENDNVSSHNLADPVPSNPLPIYFKITWLFFNICLAVNVVVTTIFWIFLNPPYLPPLQQALNVNLHAMNTVIIYFELFFTAVPVRITHSIYPLIYGLLYASFSLVYYLAGGVNPVTGGLAIYPNLLDWTNPGRTVVVVAAVVLLALPLTQLAGYGGYRLRVFIHRRCCLHEGRLPIDDMSGNS